MLRRRLSLFFLVVSMMVAIYVIESVVTRLFGDQTLAPLLSVLCCAALVFAGYPRLILAVIPFFAVETYFLIMDSSIFPMIRTSTMVLGGLLAYWTCRQRRSLTFQLAELDIILEKIETPWILCDRTGNIHRISQNAASLAGGHAKDLLGISFFSMFGAGPSKGELIQKFLRSADLRQVVGSVFLASPCKHDLLLHASFVPLQTRSGIGVLTVFSRGQLQKKL